MTTVDKQRYDWIVESNNKAWRDSYYAKRALADHQAKGIPDLYLKIMNHLVVKYGIRPDRHVILDPMCGIGTTLMLANLSSFESIGIELEKKYFDDMIGFDERQDIEQGAGTLFDGQTLEYHVDGNIEKFAETTGRLLPHEFITPNSASCYSSLSKQNENFVRCVHYKGSHPITIINNSSTNSIKDMIDDVISLGDKKLVVVTSPPYTRITEHDASQIEALPEEKRGGHKAAGYEHPDNIAMKMPYDYRMAMRKVYENLYDAGVELCVIVTRDFIDKGSVFALWAHNKSELEWQKKFELVEHIYAKIPDMSLFKRINHENFHKDKGLPLIDWEDVCIYRRL